MKTLIIVPTYNEKENIASLLLAIAALNRPELSVLVVDDSSPDGTADAVERQSKALKLPIHLLKRAKKDGLGRAYMAGFAWGMERGFDFCVSMDADLSHRPQDLPKLLDAPEADIVIGSRYVPGGKIEGWDMQRQLNSRLANFVTRIMLGLPPKDVTAGFKRYNRAFLASLDYHHIIASGYAFQVEMIFQATKRGFRVIEVPIIFVDRANGQSKISGELGRSARIVWRLAWRRRGLRQFIKFLIAGLIGTIIDWTVFALLRGRIPLPGQSAKQMAKAGSFMVSSAVNYLINRNWTFQSSDKRLMRQAARFYAVATVGLAANNLIFFVITSPRGARLPDIYGLLIATATVALWNFWANKRWTFT